MKRIKVSEIKPGMILAEKIISPKGQILAEAGTAVSAQQLLHLSYYGIKELAIQDEADAIEKYHFDAPDEFVGETQSWRIVNSQEFSEFKRAYEKCADSYKKIFNRLGIGNDTFRTFASGGAFSKYSDEFQTLCEVGEDIIYLDREKGIAVNEEVYTDEVLADLGLDKSKLEQCKAAEVGNIFTLGYRFSDALDLCYNDEDGKRQKVFMGSYGIGPSRVMGVIAEKLSDDKGLVWPEEIAPYKYYIVGIGEKGEEMAAKLHDMAPEDIILDDRKNARTGEKFADAELMGIPYRVVISDKTLADNKVELKNRKTDETKLLTLDEFTSKLA